jgi:hypothetical protein
MTFQTKYINLIEIKYLLFHCESNQSIDQLINYIK